MPSPDHRVYLRAYRASHPRPNRDAYMRHYWLTHTRKPTPLMDMDPDARHTRLSRTNVAYRKQHDLHVGRPIQSVCFCRVPQPAANGTSARVLVCLTCRYPVDVG